MKNQLLCFSHNPKVEHAKKEAVRKGGLSRKRQISGVYALTLERPGDVKVLLADTINQLRLGKIDAVTARCLGILASQFINTTESTEARKNWLLH